MTLFLDTTNFDEATVRIEQPDGSTSNEIALQAGKQLSRLLVPTIEALLREADVDKRDLSGITVNTGPGSFTGTRIGVSVANSLGLALDIPVNGIINRPAVPMYNQEPHITKPNV